MSKKTYITILLAVLMTLPGTAGAVTDTDALMQAQKPFTQHVTITAYYSPKPTQCCYVKGSFADDAILNGNGIRGADGTPVYPGMAAAPKTYPFGTRLVLPGIGTVTVHDRGGAINEWSDTHRIDLWVGEGEEGLARALAFGVQEVTATVYPAGSAMPAEKMDLASLPSPPDKIRPYVTEGTTTFDLAVKAGDRTASAEFLQEKLKEIGYFDRSVTGFFGPDSQAALASFLKDMGSTAPSDRLTEESAGLLEAAAKRAKAVEPIDAVMGPGSSKARVSSAQRLLRFLGYYNGRTNGVYDDKLKAAVARFQVTSGLIAGDHAPGAGRIGPNTRRALNTAWRRALTVKMSQELIAEHQLIIQLTQKGYFLSRTLSKGDAGKDVRTLQAFLIRKKFLEPKDQTGTFGQRTEKALKAYQVAAGIIATDSQKGSGVVGPATLASIRRAQRTEALRLVREKGVSAL